MARASVCCASFSAYLNVPADAAAFNHMQRQRGSAPSLALSISPSLAHFNAVALARCLSRRPLGAPISGRRNSTTRSQLAAREAAATTYLTLCGLNTISTAAGHLRSIVRARRGAGRGIKRSRRRAWALAGLQYKTRGRADGGGRA